jgi:hypothetical protein
MAGDGAVEGNGFDQVDWRRVPISPRSFRNVFGGDDFLFNLEHLDDVRVVGAVHGPLERWGQRVGLFLLEASELLAATPSHGSIPQLLCMAHIIACGVEWDASRCRP